MGHDNIILDQLKANINIGSESNSGWGSWGVVPKKSEKTDAAPNAKPLDTEPTTHDENSDVADNGSIEKGVTDDAHDVSDDDDFDEFEDNINCDFGDDYDLDESEKSHETRKQNKWLKPFFEAMDALKVDEIDEPNRQWHCPVCHDGPIAIRWFKGMQALIAHVNTKSSIRIELHREFASLLEEELQRRRAFIVWPPMVVVMNTSLGKDENDKWIGMENEDLLDYFRQYAALKARHSYGPNGHSGMSILIFEASVMGFEEAGRLHRMFAVEGRDRDAWERRRVLSYPGDGRHLYGYLAHKEDLEIFNEQSEGKHQLKFGFKSYQEMVGDPMRRMTEASKNLIWYMSKTVNQEQCFKAFEKSYEVFSQKLREVTEENRILRLRTKMQHEENKEELGHQECFFKQQMKKIHMGNEVKEQGSEKLLQEDADAKHLDMESGTYEDRPKRKEAIERLVTSKVKGAEKLEAEKEKLIQTHEEKKVELLHKHIQEDFELEREYYAALSQLMDKCTPSTCTSEEVS